MHGYGPSSYGEAIADVYDEWYAADTEIDAMVAALGQWLPERGRMIELGVGTGRLAIPLADAGFTVTGIDTSTAMLERLRVRDRSGAITVVVGDMVDDLPDERYDLALASYNTIFNLVSAERQQACFIAVADRLVDGGLFVVETFVPAAASTAADPMAPEDDITIRSMTVDAVVLSVARDDPANQMAEGHFIELSSTGGVRMRPWMIRYCTPGELDAMAAHAGLDLIERWAGFDDRRFHAHSQRQIAFYRRRDR